MSDIGPVLWTIQASSPERGTYFLRISEEPDGHLGFSITFESGELVGMSIPREDVQELRHVLTSWLVEMAPQVGFA